jgi:hypothetical protein
MNALIDRLAEKLAINPDHYDASDSEQALVLAIEASDLSGPEIIQTVAQLEL